MTETSIMARYGDEDGWICTSSYPIKKNRRFSISSQYRDFLSNRKRIWTIPT